MWIIDQNSVIYYLYINYINLNHINPVAQTAEQGASNVKVMSFMQGLIEIYKTWVQFKSL